MARHHFEFKYPVADLLPLVGKHAQHHRGREEHYRKEYAKAEDELKRNGIVMVENAASVASGNLTGYGYGGRSHQPQLDQRLVEAVDKAKGKVCEHKGRAEEYEKYAHAFRVALRCDKAASITLGPDDVIFFKLHEQEG